MASICRFFCFLKQQREGSITCDNESHLAFIRESSYNFLRREIIVRGQSYFSRLPKYWPPISLSARRVCSVYPPPLLRGEDRLAGRRGGWGVNILEDERNRIAPLQWSLYGFLDIFLRKDKHTVERSWAIKNTTAKKCGPFLIHSFCTFNDQSPFLICIWLSVAVSGKSHDRKDLRTQFFI
jgi:hypothetical protein